jgi:hypothetical protein
MASPSLSRSPSGPPPAASPDGPGALPPGALRLGTQGYWLCRCPGCHTGDSVAVYLPDRRAARDFLRRFRHEATVLAGLRRLATGWRQAAESVTGDEEEVLEHAAALIELRDLCVRRTWVKAAMPVVQVRSSALAFPLADRTTNRAEPPRGDSPTFPAAVAAAAMASTLKNAAREGAAVCEVCEQARRQVEAKPVHWIEIEMVDEEDQPVSGERYVIVLPNGRAIQGFLDSKGQARVDGVEDAGNCQVLFPELDLEAWQPA